MTPSREDVADALRRLDDHVRQQTHAAWEQAYIDRVAAIKRAAKEQ